MIFLKPSGWVHFEMSSREPFLERALGIPGFFSRTSSFFQAQSCSSEQPAPTHHGHYQKGFLSEGMSSFCQSRGIWGSSISVPNPPGPPSVG